MRFYKSGSQYKDIFDYIKDLYLVNGDLYRIGEYKSLASSKSDSAIQYKRQKKNYFCHMGF